MNEQRMRELLKSRGLERIANKVAALMQPSLRLTLLPQGDSRYVSETIKDDTPIGISKVGGTPDFPPGFEWPYWEDIPLSFVAQINLAEVAAFDEEHLLPSSGILYIFYDSTMQAFLYEGEGDNWKVFYRDGGDPPRLVRTAPPPDLPEGGLLRTCRVIFRRETTIPMLDSVEFDLLGLEQYGEASDNYRLCHVDFTEERDANLPRPVVNQTPQCYIQDEFGHWLKDMDTATVLNQTPQHRMLGCPDIAYNDGRWDCLGNAGEELSLEEWRRQHALEALKWRLLFQIDTDDSAELNWGDAGMIYFFIHEDDLRAKRFDRVHANYEGH